MGDQPQEQYGGIEACRRASHSALQLRGRPASDKDNRRPAESSSCGSAPAENTVLRGNQHGALGHEDVAHRSMACRAGGVWHRRRRADAFEAAHGEAAQAGFLVIGEALTEAQVPSIYRLGNASLLSEKIAHALEMPLKRARDVLGALFARFPAAAAGPREA
jgi:hypothetical protein